MRAFGVDRPRAETYMPLGCGEIEFDHWSFGTPSGSLNVLKILELAIGAGTRPMTGWKLGPDSRRWRRARDFADFLAVYHRHLEFYIEAQAVFEKYLYEFTGRRHPFMIVTMLYDGCLERGKADLRRRVRPLGRDPRDLRPGQRREQPRRHPPAGLRTEADVRSRAGRGDGRRTSSALERQRKLLLSAPKYGNDDAQADGVLVDLHNLLSATIRAQAPQGRAGQLSRRHHQQRPEHHARALGRSDAGRQEGR